MGNQHWTEIYDGNKFRELRKQKGFALENLPIDHGSISARTAGDIEKGDLKITLESVMLYARILLARGEPRGGRHGPLPQAPEVTTARPSSQSWFASAKPLCTRGTSRPGRQSLGRGRFGSDGRPQTRSQGKRSARIEPRRSTRLQVTPCGSSFVG